MNNKTKQNQKNNKSQKTISKNMKVFSLIIIFAFMFIATTAMTSAYDISITEFDVTNVNPPQVGVAGNVELVYMNIGSNDFTTTSGYIQIDFGDGSTENVNMAPLTNTTPLNKATVLKDHAYSGAGVYTITATYIPATGDTDATNNQLSTSITVTSPSYDFSIPDFDFQIVQDFSETHGAQINNDGATTAQVILQLDGDLISGSNMLSANDVSIDIVGVSGTTFVFTAGTYKNIGITADIDMSQEVGTYTGTLQLVDANNPSTIYETSTIEVLVLDNGYSSYVNHAPVISSITNQQVAVGNEFIFNVQATDAENDPIYYSLQTAPAGMIINSNGQISGWTPVTTGNEDVIVKVTDLMNDSTEFFVVEAVTGSGSSELTLNPSTMTFGGLSQDRETFITKTLTVTNDGLETITGLTIDLLNPSGSSTLASMYDATILSGYSTTLNPGDSTNIQIELYVPADFDCDERQIAVARIIGTTTSGSVSEDAIINMQAKSYLEITDVTFEIDGDEIDYNEILEGEDVDVIVTIENIYSSAGSEIEDTYFTVEDANWDVDEDSPKYNLDTGDDDEFTTTFKLDDLMQDSQTTLIIRAYGDDVDAGFEHTDKYEIDVQIEREDDDLRITKSEFDDDTISPHTLTSRIEVEVTNYGNDDQDDVIIKIESITSGISFHEEEEFNLDSGDDKEKSFDISLPGNLAPGVYQFRITAGNDNDEESQIISLTVASSTVVNPNTGNSNTGSTGNSGVTVTNPNTGSTGTSIANPVYGQSASDIQRFTDSGAFISILLGLGLIVVILIFSFMIAANIKAKKRAKKRRAAKQRTMKENGVRRQSIQIK